MNFWMNRNVRNEFNQHHVHISSIEYYYAVNQNIKHYNYANIRTSFSQLDRKMDELYPPLSSINHYSNNLPIDQSVIHCYDNINKLRLTTGINNDILLQKEYNILQLKLGTLLLSKYYSNPRKLVDHHLNSYSTYIHHYIPQIFDQLSPRYIFHNYLPEVNNYQSILKITFKNPSFMKPHIYENNGQISILLPKETRLRNLSYSCDLYIDIHIEYNKFIFNNEEQTYQQVTETKTMHHVQFGKVPLMLNSNLCILSNHVNSHEKLLIGEDIDEMGGYFIVKGCEKVIIPQERLCENEINRFYSTKLGSKYSHYVEIKSCNPDNIIICKNITLQITNKMINNSPCIYLSSVLFKQDIPLFIIFRAFGIETDKFIMELIMETVTDPKLTNLYYPLLLGSIESTQHILTKNDAIDYLIKYVQYPYYKNAQVDEKKYQYTINALNNDLFPHILSTNPMRKVYYLGFMTRTLLNFYLNLEKDDDRDSYTKKRIDTSGILLSNLTRQYVYKITKDMQRLLITDLEKYKKINQYPPSVDLLFNVIKIHNLIKPTVLETGLNHSLQTGNWGLKNNANKKGVAQVLKRVCHNDFLSIMRRVCTYIEKTNKIIHPRELHLSAWGYICPCESPEGISVGSVKNLAITCEITEYVDSNSIVHYINQSQLFIPFPDDDIFHPSNYINHTKVFINGSIIGFTSQFIQLYQYLLHAKRNLIIHYHTSLYYWNNCLYINTDAGRVIRPVLIIQNNELVLLNHIEMIEQYTWIDLLTHGIIEYIDSKESQIKKICRSLSTFLSFNEDEKNQYDYCELDSSVILGISSGSIPLLNHNQSPRNAYQCAMGKQRIGNNSKLPKPDRLDTLSYKLNNGQIPLVATNISKITKQNDYPGGNNVCVAIMTYGAYNIEDAILINKGSTQRGLFSAYFYKTYKDDEKRNRSTSREEKFGINTSPEVRCLKTGSYANLDSNGFAKKNTFMKGGDVLIGKTILISDIDDETQRIYTDHSTTMLYNEFGYVNDIYTSRNSEGYRFCKIQLRTHRLADVGDKFSSRHGQKGIVGYNYSMEDFPFTKNGIIPDIIINPHAIPSRMTIAQIFESLLGNIACELGMFGNGTPFTQLQTNDLGDILQKLGLNRHGEEILYNGLTGEQIKTTIFIGTPYYQRLKHCVEDKIHARSVGPRVFLTRQPTEGRARCGGNRCGEMERDCGIAHGISCFIKEKMNNLSDPFEIAVSKKSGLIAAINAEKNIYETFDEENDYSNINIPYATKLLMQELYSMGIAARIRY